MEKMIPFTGEDWQAFSGAEMIDKETQPHIYTYGPLTLIHGGAGVWAFLEDEEEAGWWIYSFDRDYLWDMCTTIIAATKNLSKKQMREYFDNELGL